MDEAQFTVSMPSNEPVHEYRPGSPERTSLKNKLKQMSQEIIEIPLIIGGREIKTGSTGKSVMPHNHGHTLAVFHNAGKEEVEKAIIATQKSFKQWAAIPWSERVSVFLKAAELLSGPWRDTINASTILGQSKSVYQSEIDAAAEMADFFRFNAHFTDRIYSEQPASSMGIWDRLEWRPLEGFVFAVSPFNFTSIAGNLACAPAMMGNTIIWKPASNSVLSAYYTMQLLMEAGLPDGVINFVPGPGSVIANQIFQSRDLAGVHFTGSTKTFHSIWRKIGERIDKYRSYPRIVGETGGKDFVIAHESADIPSLATALFRGAFEFQGQKCSAASRAYIPEGLWEETCDLLVSQMTNAKMGDPAQMDTFLGAVIDKDAFDRISSYIEYAETSDWAKIVAGGHRDDSKGYFIEPTIVLTDDPHFKLLEEEIFGPVLTVYVYPECEWEQTLELVNSTSPYALTGAVFANDRIAIQKAHRVLRHAAGNFYVNDKPTGAVVGMQPFGGSRASGTNDKAGSILHLLRWVTPRTIKETFAPPTQFDYPHMLMEKGISQCSASC